MLDYRNFHSVKGSANKLFFVQLPTSQTKNYWGKKPDKELNGVQIRAS